MIIYKNLSYISLAMIECNIVDIYLGTAMPLTQDQLAVICAHTRDETSRAAIVHLVEEMAEQCRRQSEAALRESRGEYDDLASNLPVIVYRLHTVPGRGDSFEYISPQVEQICGLKPNDLMRDHRPLFNQMHPDERARATALQQQALETMQPFSWEGRMIVGDKIRYFELHSQPRRLDDGSVLWTGIQRDVTERWQLRSAMIEQETLRVALEKERELNDVKRKMMTRVSHEFRTPLSTTLTAAELLQRYGERMTLEQRQAHTQNIIDHILQIAAMLEAISLLLTQEQTILHRAPTDLESLCIDLLEQIRAKTGHQIVFRTSGTTRLVSLDVALFKLLLNHLLSNAVKFSPVDTSIYLELHTDDTYVKLLVRDFGIGIRDDDLDHIFEPFYRGRNFDEIEGAGLGLAVVSNIVMLHGGNIQVDSTPGFGTAFTATLPV
jgi:PAS domain S-box-containing protein